MHFSKTLRVTTASAFAAALFSGCATGGNDNQGAAHYGSSMCGDRFSDTAASPKTPEQSALEDQALNEKSPAYLGPRKVPR